MATRLFASGGSLDSQTSETQWYKNLSGSDGRVFKLRSRKHHILISHTSHRFTVSLSYIPIKSPRKKQSNMLSDLKMRKQQRHPCHSSKKLLSQQWKRIHSYSRHPYPLPPLSNPSFTWRLKISSPFACQLSKMICMLSWLAGIWHFRNSKKKGSGFGSLRRR